MNDNNSNNNTNNGLQSIIATACEAAYQLGHQQGFEKGAVFGYASAMNDVKSAISDGTRHGSSLCASSLTWYRKP